MDYGDIFVGTFRTIWRNKRLWLFAIIAQLLPALAAVLAAAFTLNFVRSVFQVVGRAARGGGPLPPNLGMQIGASWLGFACLALLIALASYVVHLIMRGAIINEASIAWAGALTDWQRGLRTGTARAPYMFLLDLLWWVPLAVVISVVYGGGFGVWIAAAAGLGNSNQAGQGGLIALTFCGLLCCAILFGIALAIFYGLFAPLMYQSAVQGRKTTGQAAAEGWELARGHLGPMFIFLLLVFVIFALASVLMRVVAYPLQLSWVSSWMEWAAALPRGGGTFPPTLPQFNTPLVIGGAVLLALIGMVVNSFVDAFGLTLYAAVYRRLTGRHLALSDRDLELPPAPPAPSAATSSAGTGATEDVAYGSEPRGNEPVVPPSIQPPEEPPIDA